MRQAVGKSLRMMNELFQKEHGGGGGRGGEGGEGGCGQRGGGGGIAGCGLSSVERGRPEEVGLGRPSLLKP